jgi:hypothetical protein
MHVEQEPHDRVVTGDVVEAPEPESKAGPSLAGTLRQLAAESSGRTPLLFLGGALVVDALALAIIAKQKGVSLSDLALALIGTSDLASVTASLNTTLAASIQQFRNSSR